MTVRAAKYADISGLCALMRDGHARSKYADVGGIDTAEARQIFMGAIQRMASTGPGACCVFVAEGEEGINGVFIGVLERVYHVGDKLSATDLFFYTAPGANPWAASTMLEGFEKWASANPRVIEIRLGVTDVIDANPETLAGIYEKRGYKRVGVILERKVA
jgi:hypothetical protein